VNAVLLVLTVYAVASVITFFVYGADKRAARRGRWRTPEATLHLLELLGGFPGAILAQRVFRHKRGKVSYLIVFWFIVALHIAGWTGWFWLRSRASDTS
jgi:uncharacterized membrane protein YsdA (DUF1294 family)